MVEHVTHVAEIRHQEAMMRLKEEIENAATEQLRKTMEQLVIEQSRSQHTQQELSHYKEMVEQLQHKQAQWVHEVDAKAKLMINEAYNEGIRVASTARASTCGDAKITTLYKYMLLG